MSESNNTVCKQKISDSIHQNYNYENYSLLADIILAILLYYSYISLPSEQFSKFLKYYILLLLIRYFLSNLTTIEIEGKKYFQLSSHMSLFLLILLIDLDNKVFGYENYMEYLSYLFIIIYGTMLSLFKIQYSTDVINTIIITIFIYKSNLLNILEQKNMTAQSI